MKQVMKLKREVILRIRDLARNLHDAYGDKPQSLDLAKDEFFCFPLLTGAI